MKQKITQTISDTKTQHTPGPWKVWKLKNKSFEIGASFHTESPDGGYDATIVAIAVNENAAANARLIAAAPELLAACKRAQALYKAVFKSLGSDERNSKSKSYAALCAAITEAEEGRS